MVNSINTNIAAYSAQSNIGIASDKATRSVARLSSGQRIIQASDDVSALTTGTTLRTGVTTLRRALLNSSQGTSLLQVADGALGQIVELLQRQKALTVQAGSGSLSNTDRGYLDLEFKALSDEIDRLAKTTTFGSVQLLDGSLSGSIPVASNINNVPLPVTATPTPVNVISVTGALTAANTLTVNGVVINFATTDPGTSAAVGRVSVGSSAANSAANIAAFLNRSTDARLSNLTFVATGANIVAHWAGGQLNGVVPVTVSASGAGLTGTSSTITAVGANPPDGMGLDRVRAIGTVSGTVLANGGTTAALAGNAIDTRLVVNNPAFIGQLGKGQISKIDATYVAIADTMVFEMKVGDITYNSTATLVSGAAPLTVTMTGRDNAGNAAGGSFAITLRGGATAVGSINGQDQTNLFVRQINDSLEGFTFAQNRDVTSFLSGSVAEVGGVIVGTLQGASINARMEDFSSVNLESIKFEAPSNGSLDALVTAVINGETYRSASGIGSQILTNTSLTLQNISTPWRSVTIQTGNTAFTGTTALDISSEANANAITKLFEDALGLSDAPSKLTFQVGLKTTDSLGVKLGSVTANAIYGNNLPKVDTQVNAAEAGKAVDVALVKVISARAAVGALQSRFEFASVNIQSALQNQDAARSELLDADIASESTDYATYQVQVQAGISVLAQANQLPQNLLQLLQ
ncbi:MAG: flagellin [Alphaproteobacteria bacterium]